MQACRSRSRGKGKDVGGEVSGWGCRGMGKGVRTGVRGKGSCVAAGVQEYGQMCTVSVRSMLRELCVITCTCQQLAYAHHCEYNLTMVHYRT